MKKSSDSGNVLFMILIAVALFATLSYAISSSTRSGNGDVSKENNKLLQSGLQNYIAGLKGTIDRMVAGGISLEEIDFCTPTYCSPSNSNKSPFDQNGGGYLTYRNSTDVGSMGFILSNQLENVGTTGGAEGNDVLVTFLVSQSFCQYINGNGSIPNITGFVYTSPSPGNSSTAFSAQISNYPGSLFSIPSEGCLTDSTYIDNYDAGTPDQGLPYVYYYVLYAR
jgi:hypothetical protein